MKVCYFGIYSKRYPRNNILIQGLEANGVEVIECNSRAKGFKKYWELYSKYKKIKEHDVVVVGFLGQGIMPWAKLICKKKIIFDAFVSLYNTNVFDRKRYSQSSLKAKFDYFRDKISCQLADVVLLDTQAHIDYFVKTFNLPKDKFKKIYAGADNKYFYPKEKKDSKFIVHFHGYLVPFHGIEYVIEAANILKNEYIKWQIVTRFTSRYEKIKQKVESQGLQNVVFHNEVSQEELNTLINNADICLGVFGNTPKKDLVIPNKIFESLACKKPLITSESTATKEILENAENVLFCKTADPQDLADKVMKLKDNPDLRNKIAASGHELYQQRFQPKILGQELVNIIKQTI
ncbi:glycosyltransferase family 4 protein [Patescibacteria group bacterium]|nr:glycosyltransferase family 4 protein [Patescibacteria group bacterium]